MHMRIAHHLVITLVAVSFSSSVFADQDKIPIPKTEKECTAKGGKWVVLGLPYPNKAKVCDLNAVDAGIECTDSTQCQGACFAPKDSVPGLKITGSCSQFIINYGNLLVVKEGAVESVYAE